MKRNQITKKLKVTSRRDSVQKKKRSRGMRGEGETGRDREPVGTPVISCSNSWAGEPCFSHPSAASFPAAWLLFEHDALWCPSPEYTVHSLHRFYQLLQLIGSSGLFPLLPFNLPPLLNSRTECQSSPPINRLVTVHDSTQSLQSFHHFFGFLIFQLFFTTFPSFSCWVPKTSTMCIIPILSALLIVFKRGVPKNGLHRIAFEHWQGSSIVAPLSVKGV